MTLPIFNRRRLKIQPLRKRRHDLALDNFLPLPPPPSRFRHVAIPVLAERMRKARAAERPVILMMGGHVIRAGVSRLIIDLMQKRLITHVAMNGAGPIHDWELSLIGATTESVARYIKSGKFGLWRETGAMNDAIRSGARRGLGMGEAIGRSILRGKFPHRDISILASGARLGVPVTVHVGIGYDIIHEHPNCDGAALGATSYRDFLLYTQTVTRLEGGVLLCFGSAVMGPEVFLKALAMARNVAHQRRQRIKRFTTGVFDLIPLPGQTAKEAPKTNPLYYYRPWKTLLARTVAGGGQSFYVQGDHRDTFTALYSTVVKSFDR